MTKPWSRALVVLAFGVTSCVYYNSMYDTKRDYARAVELRREGSAAQALVVYDSVIAKAGRLIEDHPESSHAAPAAMLKARAELARGNLWESLIETASIVPSLTSDPAVIDLAAGFEGIGRRHLGEFDEAEALLTRAIESGPPAEDLAQFHFHRGLNRLALGDARGAAVDLEIVGASAELSPEVRLDLADGLLGVGQYGEAVRLTAQLLRENRFANFQSNMWAHLDSLIYQAPAAVDSALAEQLAEPEMTPQKRSVLHYYRGRAREVMGDVSGALAEYDSARVGGVLGRSTSEASYRWARLRLAAAEVPSDILQTRDALRVAGSIPDVRLAAHAGRLSAAVSEFASLVEAYETRGATAAEAALRGAEIAGTDLGARRVARGLYLRYLDLASDARWDAKAIAGAILYADRPAGDWAGDEGAATDARLRDQLAALPPSDPYRASLLGLPRDADADSAYVEAERALQRRITEIRMLYDTTAVFVAPTDTLSEDTPEEDEPAEQAPPGAEE